MCGSWAWNCTGKFAVGVTQKDFLSVLMPKTPIMLLLERQCAVAGRGTVQENLP
jgi:arginine/ornithine N-succinyltransferase beta subunit